MLRTKDFLIAVIGCILLAMLIGLFLPSPMPMPQTVLPLSTPPTAAPYKDSYSVFLSAPSSDRDARDVFIEKLRLEYAPHISPRQAEPPPQSEVPFTYGTYLPPETSVVPVMPPTETTATSTTSGTSSI